MKQTLITVFVSVFIGGFAVYFLIKKPEPPPQNESVPQLENRIIEKPTYTESEVQQKIELEKEKSELKHKWRELITCEHSGGVWGGMLVGGFEDVTIRIKNNSDYMIDKLVVDVFIYRGLAENKQCHSEPITFTNIPPNTEKSKKYSHTQCGQRLETIVRAVLIESLNLSLSSEIE